MNKDSKAAEMIINATLFDMTEEERNIVEACRQDMQAVIQKHGDEVSAIAITLALLELESRLEG